MRSDESAVECRSLPLGELSVTFVDAGRQLDLGILRTGLQAAATAHALAQRIGRLLLVGRLPRAGAQIVITVDRDPSLDLLERAEQTTAIDHQIAQDREFAHRPQFDL